MTQTWTRRQLLGRTGTAAVGLAGLGLAGCSARVLAGAAGAASSADGAPPAEGLQHFVTRPDLHPPVITVTQHGTMFGDPRFIFLTAPISGPGPGGAMIIDRQGELVYFGSDTDGSKFDFRPQSYQGKPVLAYFDGFVSPAGYGEGSVVLADASYRPVHTVHAAHGLKVDLHEVQVTPQGTVLITVYKPASADLSPLAGPRDGQVLSGVLQEIDIATGKLVYEWDSLDHVPVTESYLKYPGGKVGTKAKPFDYFHINSIAIAPDGDLIVSARNTWAVYKISRPSGKIVWRLNGRKSDFTMGQGTNFYWQHDARPHGTSTLTVFDDGGSPDEEKQSRALLLDVDTSKMAVRLTRAYIHPGRTILAEAMGNAQLLPDGRMFVGWGTAADFSEFAPSGRLLLDGAMPAQAPSYRVFTADWTGHPAEPPAVVAHARHSGGANVFVSWNGATEVASWAVLAGRSASSLAHVATAPRTGFETAATVTSSGPHFAVEARSGSGHVLSRSAVVAAT